MRLPNEVTVTQQEVASATNHDQDEITHDPNCIISDCASGDLYGAFEALLPCTVSASLQLRGAASTSGHLYLLLKPIKKSQTCKCDQCDNSDCLGNKHPITLPLKNSVIDCQGSSSLIEPYARSTLDLTCIAEHDSRVMTARLLQQRLLQDIAELQTKPYPGIALHIGDDLVHACLILTPEDQDLLHLTIKFHERYPLEPPKITIQSKIAHPNIYQDYICASILNTTEGYTPAYTLKGICIQLLSFFSSDKIEQDYGGAVDLKKFAREGVYRHSLDGRHVENGFACAKCGFGFDRLSKNSPTSILTEAGNEDVATEGMQDSEKPSSVHTDVTVVGQKHHLIDMPNELLVLISEFMEEETLFLAARAWDGFSRLLQSHNLIQIREMKCFTLKEGFKQSNLGVGIDVRGKKLQSEFDYVSKEAFNKLRVRTSVQGLPFTHWLPLPFSEAHWRRVKGDCHASLQALGRAASIPGPIENVLYAFMNDITVKLCETTSGDSSASIYSYAGYVKSLDAKSTLTHASEKAVESYIQLYHLLITLATDNPEIAADASRRVKAFVDGDRSKTSFPNLGHLLVALLIADTATTEDLTVAIIKEAVTRNVVWMLDDRGAGMAGLSFLEPSGISNYRLDKTYEASQTSYNLLMFAHLMRKTVTAPPPGSEGSHTRTLQDVRNELFSRNGSPPAGAATELAASIRRIQEVKAFPAFLIAMNVPMPTKAEFTRFLRRTVCESVDKGYSQWAISQEEALTLRRKEESSVESPEGMRSAPLRGKRYTFFPTEQKRKRGDGGEPGGRGGGDTARGGRGTGNPGPGGRGGPGRGRGGRDGGTPAQHRGRGRGRARGGQ